VRRDELLALEWAARGDLDAEAVDALRRYCSWWAGLDLRLVRDDSLIFGEHNGGHLNLDRFSRRSPDRSR